MFNMLIPQYKRIELCQSGLTKWGSHPTTLQKTPCPCTPLDSCYAESRYTEAATLGDSSS